MVDPSSPRALLVEKVKQLKLNLLNGRILKKRASKMMLNLLYPAFEHRTLQFICLQGFIMLFQCLGFLIGIPSAGPLEHGKRELLTSW